MGLATRAQCRSGGVPRNEVLLHPTARLPLLAAVALVLAACAGWVRCLAPPVADGVIGGHVHRLAECHAVQVRDTGQPLRLGADRGDHGRRHLRHRRASRCSGCRAAPADLRGALSLRCRTRHDRRPKQSASACSAGSGTSGARSPCPAASSGGCSSRREGGPVTLVGEPDSKLLCIPPFCDPAPGSPEAFGELWRRIVDPVPWLGGELGSESPFVPTAYALLVGPAPPGPRRRRIDRRLAIGGSARDVRRAGREGFPRCGIVSGADAEALRPALEGAGQQSQWVQDPATSATFGIKVRPIIAGEDPCTETFGD